MKEYKFELLTPCFCHGVSKNEAEMRVPSIRGHLRRWHAILYGAEEMEKTWGTAHGKVVSSRVILRLQTGNGAPEERVGEQVLPHVKSGPKAFSSNALKNGMRYQLSVAFRPLTSPETQERVDQVITSWLYLGCVGMRSSRAFGSVWPLDAKPEMSDFAEKVKLAAAKLTILVSSVLPKPDLAICTDTLSGYENETYFGYVRGRERMTSPLKMKYIRLSDGLHLMLYAEDEKIVTGALKQLKDRGKPLGKMGFQPLSRGVRS